MGPTPLRAGPRLRRLGGDGDDSAGAQRRDYTIGAWIGTTCETFVDESAAAKVRLEGSVKELPQRLVELLVPWSCRRLEPDDAITNGG